MKSNKGKVILTTSLLATALLGAGVLANSVADSTTIKEYASSKNKVISGRVAPAIGGEEEGIYKSWIPYYYHEDFIKRTNSTTWYDAQIPVYVNYILKTEDGVKKYYVGFVFPDAKVDGYVSSSTTEKDTYFKDKVNSFKEEILSASAWMLDLDKMPDDGWKSSGAGSKNDWNDPYSSIVVEQKDKTKIKFVEDISDWPFSETAMDIFGTTVSGQAVDGVTISKTTTFEPWQHLLLEIPVTDETYDHLFGKNGEVQSGNNFLYEWDPTPDLFNADAMSVESNFAIQKFQFRKGTGDGTLVFGIDLGPDSKSSTYSDGLWANASDRDLSIWLRYPEPTLKVTNAVEDSDGNLVIGDGSFGSGYNIDIEYNHTVTDEKFSIVHGMDYKLYGPAIKGDGTTSTLWDHVWVDDSGIHRQFRTNPTDPEEMSDVFFLENNEVNAATNAWLDGTNNIGETVEGDINPDTDEKDGLGDVNIAMTDSATFTPADPDFETGLNSGSNYTTKYLFSDTDYRSEIYVDGKSTVLGQTGNSFFWPEESMSLIVDVAIDVYEPAEPVITKFEIINDPLHNETGEIKNSWSYSIDAKTDSEFNGTSYFPSGVEYVQLVGDDGTVYSEMIPATAYEETSTGEFEGTFESGNLPANKTDLALKLKVYYGQDIGYTEETTEKGNFWATTSTTSILVNTGVRGSVDYETSLAISDNTDTTATLTISTNPVQTTGTESSTDKWSEGLDAYETSNINEATVSILNAKPSDITNDDLNEWDQDTAFTNKDTWMLSEEQISTLNSTGTVDVELDGLLPNESYTFKVDLTYDGETKPFDDPRWDNSWEGSRVSTSNEVTLETNDWKVYEPDNIDLSYEFVVADATSRTGNFKYEITMDVSGNTNESDIYSPTNVKSVTFTSNEVADVVVTQESAEANEWETWIYDESSETLTVKYDSSLNPSIKGISEIDSTLSAKISSDAGETITYPSGDKIEESNSFPDRGNLEVIASSPTEKNSTENSIIFTGTIDEVIPAGANESAWNAEQYAKNTIESVDIVTDKGDVLGTTTLITEVPTKVAGDSVTQYSYEVEAKGLNPNKEYDVQAVVNYSGNSKINDEGYFAGQFPNVNEAKTFESSFDSTDGTTDALEAKAPSLTIVGSDVNIDLDKTSREISASGQFKLGVVSENTSLAFNSDYAPTEVTEIRITNGTETVFTLDDASIIDSANSDEIIVDWSIGGLDAKTSYDLQIEVDYDGGKTEQYKAASQHIQFDSGSRGDLDYTGVSYKELSNEAGPLLKMSYKLDYTGDNGYAYSDFNLLEIEKVEVKGSYTTDSELLEGQTSADLSADKWTDLDTTLLTIGEYTYDGGEHEFSLGYSELIDGLPRYPGAPQGGSIEPGDDLNNNGTYDKSDLYKFNVSVTANFPDGSSVLTSDSVYYNQFSFMKGGFTPVIRDFSIENPVITGQGTEMGPEASVKGNFWIEHRSEGFYNGYSGDAYATYNELSMWESGVQNVTLYNVTDPDRTDFTTSDPLDQIIWDISEGDASFLDEPNSFDDTPYVEINEDGEVEVRDKYDAWLNEEHNMAEFNIEGLIPGETYKFKLVVHYSGDNLAGEHTDGTIASVVDENGYDQTLDVEIAVPLAGVEPIQEEDLQFNAAKSSLTSWTLSYTVFNNEVDARYEDYVFDNIKIIDRDSDDVIAESSDLAGSLVATNLPLGTDPVNSNWEIVIETADGQELEIELNEEWLATAQTIDGDSLFVLNDDGSRDWKDSEADAVESWDVDVTDGFFTLPENPISNIGENSFELSIMTTELFNQMVKYDYVDVNSISIIDAATKEVLDAEIIEGTRDASEINILVSGLQPDTNYGTEGLDVVFEVMDKYSPAGSEIPVPVSFGNTGALDIKTLPVPEKESNLLWLWIIIVILLILSIVGAVLAALWFFMLAWRKEKETDFKPGQVSFLLNKSYSSEAKKLIGAKLTSTAGTLNYTLSEDKSGKILVTVTGITTKEPLKGLKFVLDNSTIKASNAKIEADNKALTAKFEADLKVWEDKKAKTPEGTTFSEPKPAKPTLTKLGKVASDIKIIGAVKTVKPEPKPPKPAAPAKPASAAEGNARKI